MIPVSEPDIGEKEIDYVDDAVRSGWVSSHGEYISRFENNFKSYIGTKYGLTTSNGTTALHLALSAIGIKSGDEVIVPDLTFISPVNAVLYNNGTPILCDINKENWCLDTEKLEKLITKKTKAIIVVHLYGNSADMDRIMEIKEKYNLYVIEDTAEALGTDYKNRRLGSFGDVGCFSFYGNKTMTTGEGGFCTTDNEDIYRMMSILRDHGMIPENRYWHDYIGYNYRMTNLQAALGVAQLERLDYFITKKRKIAEEYRNNLIDYVTTHPISNKYSGTYWLYSILTKDKNERDLLIGFLYKRGIDTRRFFYPVHLMPPYTGLAEHNYPISVDTSERGLNLPSSVKLTDDEIQYICRCVKEFYGSI
jgi:perosamine synthetase